MSAGIFPAETQAEREQSNINSPMANFRISLPLPCGAWFHVLLYFYALKPYPQGEIYDMGCIAAFPIPFSSG
jgi:hypothetical protein